MSMRRLRLILLACSLFAVSSIPTSAQFSRLNDLTDQIAKKLKQEKAKALAVENFVDQNSSANGLGEYFGWFVANDIKSHNKKMTVVMHRGGEAINSTSSLDSINPRTKKSETVLPEYLLTGAIEVASKAYTVHMFIHKVSDNSLLIDKSIVMQRSEFLESLVEPFPPATDYPVLKSGKQKGDLDPLHMPTCLYCPYPSYTEKARAMRVQGDGAFDVLISAEGRVVKAHCTKRLPYGLDEEAFNTIKTWRFKPATDVDGKSVAALVPIEISFRLF